MSELSPEARALLRDGEGLLRPSSKDRSRVAGVLAMRLGTAAMLAPTPAFAAPTKSILWQKLSLTAASVGLAVAGAANFWPQSSVEVAPRAPSAAQPPIADTAAAPVAPALEEQAPESSSQPTTVAPEPTSAAPAKPAVVDRLAEEVSILSRAMTVLRGGNPAEALRLLEAHRQQFPSGRLVEERRAARVQALCALGKRSAAEAELSRLERSAPRSPHVARAKLACGLK